MKTQTDMIEEMFYIYGYCIAAAYAWLCKRTTDPFKF